MALWNRTYHISVMSASGKTLLFETSYLDIKFNITHLLNGTGSKGTISIIGIDNDIINNITATSVMNPFGLTTHGYKIKLSAGYENDNATIFNGYIYSAKVDVPPNPWVHMHVDGYLDNPINKPIRISMPWHENLDTILKAFTEKTGIKCINLTNKNPRIRCFRSNGNAYSFCESVSKRSKLTALVETYDNENIIFIYDSEYKPQRRDVKVKINSATGLLAVTDVTITGASITTRLSDPIGKLTGAATYGYLELESQRIPSANGIYSILKKTFTGHFRGNEWATSYNCVRQNIR